jgi:hypothetical protein
MQKQITIFKTDIKFTKYIPKRHKRRREI